MSDAWDAAFSVSVSAAFSHSVWCPAVNNLKTVALQFLYCFIYYACYDDDEGL